MFDSLTISFPSFRLQIFCKITWTSFEIIDRRGNMVVRRPNKSSLNKYHVTIPLKPVDKINNENNNNKKICGSYTNAVSRHSQKTILRYFK